VYPAARGLKVSDQESWESRHLGVGRHRRTLPGAAPAETSPPLCRRHLVRTRRSRRRRWGITPGQGMVSVARLSMKAARGGRRTPSCRLV